VARWGLADGQAQAFQRAIDELAEWTDVVEVDLAPLLSAGELLYSPALVAERLGTVGPLLARDPDAVHPVVRQIISRGLDATAAEVFAAHDQLADLRAALQPVWDRVDALACPTVPDIPTIEAVLADPLGANTALGRWTNGVNLLGLCALTVPAGTRTDGLPGSLTFLGRAHTDTTLSAIARHQAPATQERIELAVVGAHLRGLPLHHQLTDRDARFVRACRTAHAYRLYALPTDPPKPGMVRVAPGPEEATANAIEAEVWSLDAAAFGDFVAAVPPPLTIGTIELEDGSTVKGFLSEPAALGSATDITSTGSWRAWIGQRSRGQR
jgi:allophanate hydrolase